MNRNSVSEVSCIHTCQSLEVDHASVIIGPVLIVRNGQVIADATQRASTGKSVHGYKKMIKENPEQAKQVADMIIKNTYRTLMTRGQRGRYIYCTDPEMQEYFKRRLSDLHKSELYTYSNDGMSLLN